MAISKTTSSSASAAASKTVTVKAGQTLSSIAKTNGTTVTAILAANPKFTTQDKFQNGNMIWAGTTVKIPGASTSSTTPPPGSNILVDAPVYGRPVRQDPIYSAPVQPTPPAPPPVADVSYTSEAIKIATSNLIIDPTDVPTIEEMTNLIFEDIGGRELISISRNDTIGGQQVSYQPISNINSITQQYNPQNLISLQDTSDNYFKQFPIYLDIHLPVTGSGPNGEAVYVDSDTGNLVLDFINLEPDHEIEVQVYASGTRLNDTIY